MDLDMDRDLAHSDVGSDAISNQAPADLDFIENQAIARAFDRPPQKPLQANSKGAQGRSIALESLSQQNEELQANLKFAFRKIHELEESLQIEQHRIDDALSENSRLQDQMLIWQEKETFWKTKNQKLENDLEMMNSRMPEYFQQEIKIDRYRKYQEKIKTQVKPYIHQLKSFIQSLQAQIKDQQREINQKDYSIAQFERKQAELQNTFQEQVKNFEASHRDMIESYEAERLSLQRENEAAKKDTQLYFQKALKLDQALEKLDRLENENVSISRDNQEKGTLIETLKSENFAFRKAIKEKEAELNLLRATGQQDQADLESKLTSANQEKEELREQLYSLRLMWNVKSDENEKLKLANSSLEKLNHELSLQIAKIK